MHFTILGQLDPIESIAKGRGIRSLPRLRAAFGGSNWRKMKGVAIVALHSGASAARRFTGMKRTGSAASGSKSNGSSTERKSSTRPSVAAALCLKSGGCGDLEPRKIYRVVPDKKAAAEGYLRVIDDSGEDYFAMVRLSAAAAKVLVR